MTNTNDSNPPVPPLRPPRAKHSNKARIRHSLFPPGTKAQIVGLTAKPHYNGRIGTTGWYYPRKQRIAITIQEEEVSFVLSIKLCNLCTMKLAKNKAYMTIAPILANAASKFNEYILKRSICQHYFPIVESTIISMKTDLSKHHAADIPSLPMMMYMMEFPVLLKLAQAINEYGKEILASSPENASYSEDAIATVDRFMSHMQWSLLFR